MSQRLFLLDKNYILKQVQSDLRFELEKQLVEQIKEGYFLLFNPLHLVDDLSEMVEAFNPVNLTFFDELYDNLAGIFRFQEEGNQLELLFDGRSHYEKYLEDWKTGFNQYTNALCFKKNFILAGLELTVFHSPDKRIELAQNRMKVCIYEHFGLKIYKYKGIQKYCSSKSA
uniref:hypothetical protein n=1 Tax=Roseivirga sp. TaxID=1964215 RepID=UPI0040472051